MITGNTRFLAHIGWPTHTFKAPMIYNPWLARAGCDVVVVPWACEAEDFATVIPTWRSLKNLVGALVTMPHKVSVVQYLDDVSTAVRIAGSCNAVRREADGRLVGDMFDGEGFVRGVRRKGVTVEGARVLVVGAGGVGSAIAASFAIAGVGALSLYDSRADSAEGLAGRLRSHCPAVEVRTGSNDPAGFDLIVNATPLGMKADDPLPFDMDRVSPSTFVGEVVMKQAITPLLAAAQAKGCPIQVGTDMLFEMIPAYLEFFGFGTTTPDELRAVAQISY